MSEVKIEKVYVVKFDDDMYLRFDDDGAQKHSMRILASRFVSKTCAINLANKHNGNIVSFKVITTVKSKEH